MIGRFDRNVAMLSQLKLTRVYVSGTDVCIWVRVFFNPQHLNKDESCTTQAKKLREIKNEIKKV